MKRKSRRKGTPTRLVILLLLAFSSCFFSSCNVTRVIETKSQYFQKGDTTCTIVTKTIESYDASKKITY